MNEHEIERIAAAMNQMRPDWPTSSLKTLITKSLGNRPRRDVAVALAWVACESGTASPARVLEAGPWWRAAGVEGTTTRREVLAPAERCGICSKSRADCASAPRFGVTTDDRDNFDDHVFAPDFKVRQGSAVDELRDIKATATNPPTELEPTAEQTEEAS